MDVAKSTTHRLLTSLQKYGYVQQNSQTEKYSLGLKLIELGNAVQDSLDIRQIAHPYLQKLSEETGETVHLALLEADHIIYIHKIESSATIRMMSYIGKRAPAFCTGIGKAILAHMSPKTTEELLRNSILKKFTENTQTNISELMREFSSIKNKGYSTDYEEHEKGIHCVGSPILDNRNHVIAGISIAGPSMRMGNEEMNDFSEKVTLCAKNISAHFGYISS